MLQVPFGTVHTRGCWGLGNPESTMHKPRLVPGSIRQTLLVIVDQISPELQYVLNLCVRQCLQGDIFQANQVLGQLVDMVKARNVVRTDTHL